VYTTLPPSPRLPFLTFPLALARAIFSVCQAASCFSSSFSLFDHSVLFAFAFIPVFLWLLNASRGKLTLTRLKFYSHPGNLGPEVRLTSSVYFLFLPIALLSLNLVVWLIKSPHPSSSFRAASSSPPSVLAFSEGLAGFWPLPLFFHSTSAFRHSDTTPSITLFELFINTLVFLFS